MNRIKYAVVASFAGMTLVVPTAALCAEFDLGYDSKYVSEGRNNLIDGGIYWASVNAELSDNITVGVSYGNADSSVLDYDELNVGINYANSIGDVDYYVGYTRLEFFEDDEYDNEFSLGMTWNAFESFTPYTNFVYSTEAEGSFFELGAETEFIINERLNIIPYVVFTFDFGYVSEENNSHNHTGFGTSISYTFTENIAVSVIAEHTIGGFDVKEEGGEDKQTWAGIHVTVEY